MMSYEKLEVYQLSIQFLTLALQIASKIPPAYAELADHLKRAAMGPPRNIGEGQASVRRPIVVSISTLHVAVPWSAAYIWTCAPP